MSHMNVLTLIKGQHKILKESIEVLKQESASSDEKQTHLNKFISLLKMHSEAEEETLYDVMMDLEPASIKVLEAEEEHNVAKSLMMELENMSFQTQWTPEIAAKAKVLAEVTEHHIDEEEEGFFRLCRQCLTAMELNAIGEEFQQRCVDFQDDEREFTMAQRIQRINQDLGLNPP